MSERHRALPSWMSKKQETEKQKEPLKSRRKRKAARAVFYCMNEKELTEAAVSYLSNRACEDHVTLHTSQQVEDKTGDTTAKIRVKTAASKTIAEPLMEAFEEESLDYIDAQEMTYVSETDLDITKVETVPYTEIPQHKGSEGQRSEPVQDHSGPVNAGLQAEKGETQAQTPEDAVEDDSLRLVREIFFT